MANKDCMVNNYYGWINYINLRCDHKKTNLSAAKKERKKRRKKTHLTEWKAEIEQLDDI